MRPRTLVTTVVCMTLLLVPAAALALPSMPSSLFETSDGCGCHAALLEQWRGTMHQQALTDPLYLYKLEEALAATDGALGPYCNGCHSPIAVMSGELDGLDQSKVSAVGMEGVTCSYCHYVTGTSQPPGNTSATVADDGVRRAQLKDPEAPHPADYSAFHETAEFCGSCHDVYHPVNGLLLEGTYTEWKAGPYAAEGIVCQDCHMTPGPGVTKPHPGKAAAGGPDREHIYQMTFVGGNVGLGQADLAEERLRAAAELALEVPDIVESGDVALTTTITNVGAGHYLPTGLTEFRQMWLEVTATDQSGEELLSERRYFVTELEDAEGNAPVELWDAAAIHSDDRIPPRESTSDEYSFAMTGDAVTVTAALYYRSCTEEVAEKAGVEMPTTTMAEVTRTVYSSAAARAAGEDAGAPTGEDADEAGGLPAWASALIVIAAAALVAGAYLVVRRRSAGA